MIRLLALMVAYLFTGCVSIGAHERLIQEEFYRGRTEGFKISLEILKQSEKEDAIRDLKSLLGCSQWDLK